MNIVKRLLMVCAAGMLLFAVTGCANATQGETVAEVRRRHNHIYWNNHSQIAHDIEVLFMIDKPSRLSQMLTR
jgi:hypothetical protein